MCELFVALSGVFILSCVQNCDDYTTNDTVYMHTHTHKHYVIE